MHKSRSRITGIRNLHNITCSPHVMQEKQAQVQIHASLVHLHDLSTPKENPMPKLDSLGSSLLGLLGSLGSLYRTIKK